MTKFIFLPTMALLLAGCGSRPAPQQTQQLPPAQQQVQPQVQASNPARAEQPYPVTPQGSPTQAQPAAAQPAQTQPAQNPAGQAPARQAAADPHAEVTIPTGTPIHVRLNQALDTKRNRAGDRFTATLVTPVEEQGRIVVPRGTTFSGHVTTAKASGRMKGRAQLGITLDSFEVNGARYPVVTSRASRASAKHKKRNLVLIGGGSGLGALIGGLAGGGKGALIGAGAGAAAGTAGAAFTGKKQVVIPAETLLTFRLQEAVEL